ncbi:MAG: hypothetical protein JWM31_2169 [Solirubrobacterales bacterium]|nr:hypothetical protein [Solirubrobacterales bacterium]
MRSEMTSASGSSMITRMTCFARSRRWGERVATAVAGAAGSFSLVSSVQ